MLGVVRPTVEALATCRRAPFPGQTPPSSVEGTVAVLGTPGTIESGFVRLELEKLAPRLHLIEQACPLWVPLVETGELSGPGTEHFVHKYLDPCSRGRPRGLRPGARVHPLSTASPRIRAAVPADVRILSQGTIVAEGLGDWLRRHPEMEARLSRGGARRYVTTDDPVWFARRGEAILAPLLGAAGAAITVEKAHLAPFSSAP